VSWAAHELESYVLQKHLRLPMSFTAVLLGCLLPDLFTKLPVYGLNMGDVTYLRVTNPALYHRGWPGVGMTHSLLFGVGVSLVVLAVFRSRAWALGLLVGQWAHAVSDTFDTAGTMLLFPFSTQHVSFGMWAYAGHAGHYGDATAYYSGLGAVWDIGWLVIAGAGFAALSGRYFATAVEPADPTWAWIRRRFTPSPVALRALYRAFFVYGACRIVAWMLRARVLNPARGEQPFDLSWGGPSWVDAARFPAESWADFARSMAVGVAGLSVTLVLVWQLFGRRLWLRAG
jgi:membrane-bound metal-dependent hydrolase YbcI (DUF457 family)